MQDIVDEPLKVRESVDKAHEHDEKLIKISSSSKGRFSFFFFCHSKYVVGRSDVQRRIVSGSRELVQGFSNQRERVSILDGFLIEVSIVDAEAKTVILFLSKQDWCVSRRGRCTYKSFREILLKSFSDCLEFLLGQTV